MYIDFSKSTPSERYFTMIQSIVPRPIAWVLSSNGDESYNVAPYSFFTGICSDPPLLMFSAGKKVSGEEKGMEKDTRCNIRMREKFVVHIARTESIQSLNSSAATWNHGDSEVTRLGLETAPFEGFDLPRLKECDIAMACNLYRIDEIGHTPQAVIYGQIALVYVNPSVMSNEIPGRLVIDPVKLDPLARLGGNFYSDLGSILPANRPE